MRLTHFPALTPALLVALAVSTPAASPATTPGAALPAAAPAAMDGPIDATPRETANTASGAHLTSALGSGAGWTPSYTEAFESGVQQWTANARTALSTVPRGRGAGHAARLRTEQAGLTKVRRSSPMPVGTRQVVTAWLRAPQGRLRARLVVREIEPGTGAVLNRTRDRVAANHGWQRVKVSLTPASSASTLAITIVGTTGGSQRRGHRLLVDDVLVRGKNPTSSPTAPPSGDIAGVLTNGCTHDARGIPACGAYMGAAHGSNTEPSALEAEAGAHLGVRRTYYQATQVSGAVSTAKADLAAGRVPWISFKLPYTWEEMAAGKGDAWAQDIATKLNTLNGPVWLAFHHEPEKDGNIIAWRTMQERLGPIVRTSADNVAFTVITTGWNQLYGPAEYRFANLWPRTKVDVAGFDIYNFYASTFSSSDEPDAIKADYFDKLQVWAAQNDTVWALAETGQTDEAVAADPDWIEQTHAELAQTGGVAMAYFNTTLNSANNSWILENPTKMESFATAVQSAPRLAVP